MNYNFLIVPRSSLHQLRGNGPTAGPPNVRYHRLGLLSFSKKVADVFYPYRLAMIGFDRDATALCFTAIDKPPEGVPEAACYPIRWAKKTTKGESSNCSIAAKRLMRQVGFALEDAVNFPILAVNLERHSVIVRVPAGADDAGKEETADPEFNREYRPNGDATVLTAIAAPPDN